MRIRVRGALTGLALVVLAGGCRGPEAGPDHPEAQAPETIARSEASYLLDRARVPPDGVRTDRLPAPGVDVPPQRVATPDLVDLHRWWTVRRPVGDTLGWLEAHGFRGHRPSGTGTASGPDHPAVHSLLFDRK